MPTTDPVIHSFLLRQPICAATHFFGTIAALYVTAFLWRLAGGDRGRQVSVCCFGACMTLLYAASFLYHALPLPAAQLQYFKLFDQSAIYLLIAGTYTPILALGLSGRFRATLLAALWTATALGIGCLWVLPVPSYPLTVGMYAGMGCIGVVPAYALIQALTFRGAVWGLIGGLIYLAGGICDALHWPVLLPGWFQSHETFHVCDLIGTFIHVYFVAGILVPYHRRLTGR